MLDLELFYRDFETSIARALINMRLVSQLAGSETEHRENLVLSGVFVRRRSRTTAQGARRRLGCSQLARSNSICMSSAPCVCVRVCAYVRVCEHKSALQLVLMWIFVGDVCVNLFSFRSHCDAH